MRWARELLSQYNVILGLEPCGFDSSGVASGAAAFGAAVSGAAASGTIASVAIEVAIVDISTLVWIGNSVEFASQRPIYKVEELRREE
jgi:hypothetical protein